MVQAWSECMPAVQKRVQGRMLCRLSFQVLPTNLHTAGILLPQRRFDAWKLGAPWQDESKLTRDALLVLPRCSPVVLTVPL